jgi:hypothetical protein
LSASIPQPPIEQPATLTVDDPQHDFFVVADEENRLDRIGSIAS